MATDKKTIFRVVKDRENPYVMMDKRPLENPALSFKAKGILAYLLSRPDGWEVNVPDLVNRSTDGPSAIRSGLKELRAAGHVVYNRARDDKMHITKWIIEVHERPVTFVPNELSQQVEKDLDDDFQHVGQDGENLDGENLQVGNLQVGNRRQLINELSNKGVRSNKGKKQRGNAPVGAPPAPTASPEGEGANSSLSGKRTDAQKKGDGVDMVLDQMLIKEPVIQAYRRVMRLNVPIAMRQQVVDEVKDPQKWEACLLHWIGHGWNKQNILGLLDSYRAGGQAACNMCNSQSFPKRGQAAPSLPQQKERMSDQEIADFQAKMFGSSVTN